MGSVIGVAGCPGSGKSTFCKLLAKHLSAERIDYDDYQRMTSQRPEQVLDWLARGAPFDEIVAPGFADAIRSSRKPVVVEAPMGRAWMPTSELYSEMIWLQCPHDLALSRKLKDILQQATLEECSKDWIIAFLDQYESFVRPLLSVQEARVRPLCDHYLDASHTPRELLSHFLALKT